MLYLLSRHTFLVRFIEEMRKIYNQMCVWKTLSNPPFFSWFSSAGYYKKIPPPPYQVHKKIMYFNINKFSWYHVFFVFFLCMYVCMYILGGSVFHCMNQQSASHPDGYDICTSCAQLLGNVREMKTSNLEGIYFFIFNKVFSIRGYHPLFSAKREILFSIFLKNTCFFFLQGIWKTLRISPCFHNAGNEVICQRVYS